jgi:hypothetical protein
VRGEGHAEEISELAVEVRGAALWMLESADEDIRERTKTLGEEAEGDALAGAGIPREEREAAVGDTELDAAKKGIDSGSWVKRVGGHVGPKRVQLESVEG